MVSPTDFVNALKARIRRAAAKEREQANLARMKWLLKQDRQTFLKGLEEFGLKPGEAAYEEAVKIYDDLQ